MLREGMPVDASFGIGRTALHCATSCTQTDVIKRLLHEGADVNRQIRFFKNTPLHSAVQLNNTKVVQLLLDNGADINLKTYYKKTPLDEAHKGSPVESLLLQLQQSAP